MDQALVCEWEYRKALAENIIKELSEELATLARSEEELVKELRECGSAKQDADMMLRIHKIMMRIESNQENMDMINKELQMNRQRYALYCHKLEEVA